MPVLPEVLAALAGVLGLCFGSFANVLIVRIPKDEPIGLWGGYRSHCPHCEAKIPFWRNIPVLSFILLRGRCADCRAPISWRYPIVELLTAALFALTAYVYAVGQSMPFDPTARWFELAKLLYFTFSLVVVVFIDIDERIIPDRFSLGNWVVALVASFIWGSPEFVLSIAGALFGFGSFYLLAKGYEKWKGVEGLGFGDVKMMGWLGAWLGVWGVPHVILFASVGGLIVGLLTMIRTRGKGDGLMTALPFGPFLALAAYVVWILQSFDGVRNFGAT